MRGAQCKLHDRPARSALIRQYVNHAKEVNMPIPEVPTLFLKPANALGDPYPAPTVIPKAFVQDNAADYESELAVVIGKAAKDVTEEEAWDYLAG
jgi:2-keto-4-pentenoate hydratase/2-oxohepta-3-ene-1,7-dioic acid hydratase in catechol pathway